MKSRKNSLRDSKLKPKRRSRHLKKNKNKKSTRQRSLKGGVGRREEDRYGRLDALYDVKRIFKFIFDPNDPKARKPVYKVIDKYYKTNSTNVNVGDKPNIVILLNNIAQKLKDENFLQEENAPETITAENLNTPK